MDALTAGMGSLDRAAYAETLERLRSELGADLFDSQVRLGSQLSYVDALDAVIPVLIGQEDLQGEKNLVLEPLRIGAGLTARESEVLQCLTEGLSNKEIASRLECLLQDGDKSIRRPYIESSGVRNRAEAAVASLRSNMPAT